MPIWISKNAWLNLDEMRLNAQYILNDLVASGWSKESVCGMLGNMHVESTINPGIWQNLDEGNLYGGLGLTQWTPATKIINWSESLNIPTMSVVTQIARLKWELANGEQYYRTSSYPLNFSQFSVSQMEPGLLAEYFLYNYERPADPASTVAARRNHARYWYNLLTEGANNDTGGDFIPIRKSNLSRKIMRRYYVMRGYKK